jgi:RNA polymerase sigma factor (TIGR02999 family)
VYDELRQLARRRLAREAPGQTLQATALVHEAYLRLVGPAGDGTGGDLADGTDQRWANRGHFFAAAAEAMRRILVEAFRRKHAQKRGGDAEREPLADDHLVAPPRPHDDLLALDEALNKLAAKDPPKAELVKLRYFAGLTLAEAAQAMNISTNTADRYWAYAKAWLHAELEDKDEG